MLNDSFNTFQTSSKDLIARSGGPTDFKNCDEELLAILAGEIVELSDCGGADADSVARLVCEESPDLAIHGREYIVAVAESLLSADIVTLSKRFTELFSEFNQRYFGNRLPRYEVRVVFDLHMVANEPIYMSSVSSGLIRLNEHCIYIRYSQAFSMTATLIHEMAHAATSGKHDEEWLKQKRRLKEDGATVDADDIE